MHGALLKSIEFKGRWWPPIAEGHHLAEENFD